MLRASGVYEELYEGLGSLRGFRVGLDGLSQHPPTALSGTPNTI